MEVKFYDNVDDSFLKFAVIISKYDNKWVFCKHRECDTYEIPGGHREENEDILDTAKRELAIVDNCDTVSNGFIRFQIQSETVQQNETIALEVKTAQDHFRDLTKMI